MNTTVALIAIVAAPAVCLLYAYVGYPAILWCIARLRGDREYTAAEQWPTVTLTLPIYNGADVARATIERLLALDYPRDRLEILVISDASTDGTDDIVRSYADRGVQLVRLPVRSGKTVAENIAVARARGEIIVNVDASVLVPPESLGALVRYFADPTVGVVSGRDVSIADASAEHNGGESGYVGYEMWVRSLETRVGSIVGASGCFYGIRRQIHARELPPELSWDFASVLVAREQGFRSVSAPEAICYVPRTAALRTERARKVRTMARGLSTLFYKSALMNPARYGSFALMLVSHKLLRWLPYLLAPLSLAALAALTPTMAAARFVAIAIAAGIAGGAIGMRWTSPRALPKSIALFGFLLAAFVAGFLAWVAALGGRRQPTWEPTPRRAARVGA